MNEGASISKYKKEELLSNKIIIVFLHYLMLFKIDEASGIREVLVKFSKCGGHLLECNFPSA